MKDKIKKFVDTKQFHICMVGLIIFIILFVVGIICLIYNVEGEGKVPFYISQISVISNVEGSNVEDNINKWNLQVNQNNDIYLYVKKNDNYSDTEIIESIKIDNFNVVQSPNIGELKLFKPDNKAENVIFKNTTENEVNVIEYTGSMESNIKELKISNQGGLVVFRCGINNLGNYISNEEEEINHSELLKKIGINNDDLKCQVTFDISITLNSGKTYNSNVDLELPINDIVNNGTQSQEYKDLENVIFKRK